MGSSVGPRMCNSPLSLPLQSSSCYSMPSTILQDSPLVSSSRALPATSFHSRYRFMSTVSSPLAIRKVRPGRRSPSGMKTHVEYPPSAPQHTTSDNISDLGSLDDKSRLIVPEWPWLKPQEQTSPEMMQR